MFSSRQELWSDSSLHIEGWLYDPIILALLRDCTSESTDPRPHFQALQYRLCSVSSIATLMYFIVPITKKNLPSILHLYHHLFAELVHLYNLPLYWVCCGHKRLFVIWLQGCLRETIFILRLLQIDIPQVIHLREICYYHTNLCTWRPNNVYKKKVVQQTSSSFLAPLSGRWELEGISLDLGIESFCFLFYHQFSL